MEEKIKARLKLLKEERDRLVTLMPQYDAAIAELENLLKSDDAVQPTPVNDNGVVELV